MSHSKSSHSNVTGPGEHSHSHSHTDNSHSHSHNIPQVASGSKSQPKDTQKKNKNREEIEDEMEKEHYIDVIRAFGYYSTEMKSHIERLSDSYRSLVPPKYNDAIVSRLGYDMERKFDAMSACVRANSNFLANLISDHDSVFLAPGDSENASDHNNTTSTTATGKDSHQHPLQPGTQPMSEASSADSKGANVSKQYLSSETQIGATPPNNPSEMGKLYSTLSLLIRDWSSGGEAIRKQVHGRIIPELMKRLPLQPKPGVRTISSFSDFSKRYRVLIPGSGLCRLVFDLARLGYEVQGNEWSYMMLLTSNFILNYCNKPDLFTIYPFVSQISNVFSAEDMVQGYSIPDVSPFVLPPDSSLRMTAGDFVSIYSAESEKGKWDCVITSFFLDTARNVCDYIDTIHHCLAEGGIWINLGPLTYHWTGVTIPNIPLEEQRSLELSWSEISAIIEGAGFSFFQSSTVSAQYTCNPRSLLQRYYNCIFFTVIKSSNPTRTVGPLGPSHHVYENGTTSNSNFSPPGSTGFGPASTPGHGIGSSDHGHERGPGSYIPSSSPRSRHGPGGVPSGLGGSGPGLSRDLHSNDYPPDSQTGRYSSSYGKPIHSHPSHPSTMKQYPPPTGHSVPNPENQGPRGNVNDHRHSPHDDDAIHGDNHPQNPPFSSNSSQYWNNYQSDFGMPPHSQIPDGPPSLAYGNRPPNFTHPASYDNNSGTGPSVSAPRSGNQYSNYEGYSIGNQYYENKMYDQPQGQGQGGRSNRDLSWERK